VRKIVKREAYLVKRRMAVVILSDEIRFTRYERRD